MRVLFVIESGYGHLYPIVPLAQELGRAGHEVAVAVPAHFADAVRSVGLSPEPLSAVGLTAASEQYKAEQGDRLPVERGRVALGRYLENAVVQVPALRRVVADFRPDLLVRETTAFAGWLVGELTDLPVAVFDFAPTAPKLLALVAGDLFARAREAVGLSPDPVLRSLRGGLHMVAGAPDWYPASALGPVSRLFQPPADALGGQESPPWLEHRRPGRPTVYVTLGTVFNTTPGLFRTIFEALSTQPVQVLATVGSDVDPASLGPVPANIRVERFVPQADVLPWVDAVVAHGGYGTLMGALRHGVPVLCLPQAASDDSPNADRLAALGAGITLDRSRWSVPDVTQALRAVLGDPRFGEAARRTAEEIRRLPPFEAAVELLERLAAGEQQNRPEPVIHEEMGSR